MHRMKRVVFVFSIFLFSFEANSQSVSSFKVSNEDIIGQLLKGNPEKFKKILDNPGEYKVQIIYAKIDRDKQNIPHFTQYNYQLDPKNYFYPASLVKLPVVALSLEKINKMKEDSAKAYPKISSLSKETRMKFDSAYYCQSVVDKDTTSENGVPSIAHCIKKMMLVSDNDAYTHLYEFLGQEYVNKALWAKGYTSARIIHRFKVCDNMQNRYTNPIAFFNERGEEIYRQKLQYNPEQLQNYLGKVTVGRKSIEKNKLADHPKDFTYMNYLSLEDIHSILISIMFPNAVDERRRFQLTVDDRNFLWKYMSMYPAECSTPKYNSKDYWCSYKKYFLYGDSKDSIKDKSVRIFNVVGQSFGFLSDVAYVADFKNNVEFLISAVIYVNSDGIVNDGKYDYDAIGFPFLANLGRVIYEYEKKRTRSIVPDLKEFKMDY